MGISAAYLPPSFLSAVQNRVPTRSMSRATIAVGATLLILCMDFRGSEAGGSAFQYILMAAFFAACGYAWISCPSPTIALGKNSRNLERLALSLVVYPVLLQAFRHQDAMTFLKLELRFLVLTTEIFVIHRYLRAGGSPITLLKLVLVSAVLSTLTSSFHAVVAQGIAVKDARYKLFPTSMMIGLALCLPLLDMRGKRWVAFLIAPFGLVMMILSTTRGAAGGVVLAGLYYLLLQARQGNFQRLFIMVGVTASLFAAAALNPKSQTVQNWVSRLEAGRGYSADPTTLTRVAEYRSQFEQLTSSLPKLGFGVGLGAPYDLDYDTLIELRQAGVVSRDGDTGWSEFGHSVWVYSFFSLGLAGGWIVPALFVGAVVNSVRMTWISRPEQIRNAARFSQAVSCGIIALVIDAFIEHPFGNRSTLPILAAVFVFGFLSRRGRDAVIAADFQLGRNAAGQQVLRVRQTI